MKLVVAMAVALGALAPSSAAPTRGAVKASASASKGGSWLGVYVDGVDSLITQVLPNTPAAKGGLQPGDRVLSVGATPVATASDLINTVSALKPGTAVDIAVKRIYGDRPVIIRVVVEAKPGPSEMLRRRFLGQPLADFSLPQVGGGTIGTEDLRGDVVVIEHFGTWCLVCKSTFQTLRELEDRGAVVLALSSEERSVLDHYVASKNPEFPVLEDFMGRVQRRYDARTVPLLMVVDRDGIIRHIGVGGQAAELDLAFEAAQRALRKPRNTATAAAAR